MASSSSSSSSEIHKKNPIRPLIDSLTCSICFDLFSDPHQFVNCRHVFCLNCVLQCGERSSECPLCRTPSPSAFPIHQLKEVSETFTQYQSHMEQEKADLVKKQRELQQKEEKLNKDREQEKADLVKKQRELQQKEEKLNKDSEQLQKGSEQLVLKQKNFAEQLSQHSQQQQKRKREEESFDQQKKRFMKAATKKYSLSKDQKELHSFLEEWVISKDNQPWNPKMNQRVFSYQTKDIIPVFKLLFKSFIFSEDHQIRLSNAFSSFLDHSYLFHHECSLNPYFNLKPGNTMDRLVFEFRQRNNIELTLRYTHGFCL